MRLHLHANIQVNKQLSVKELAAWKPQVQSCET
jgi:hypothetical protein